MEFRNTSAINPQRPEALVEMSRGALMADDGRVAFETHLMNSLSIKSLFGCVFREHWRHANRNTISKSIRLKLFQVKNTNEFYFNLKIRHTRKSRGCWQFRVVGSKWLLVTLIGQVSRLIRASKKISVYANCFSLMRLLHSTAHRVAKGNVARITPRVSKTRYESFVLSRRF